MDAAIPSVFELGPEEVSLVGARGFEPPTSSSRTMRATKLRHAPTEGARLQGLRMIAHGSRTGTQAPTGKPSRVGLRKIQSELAVVQYGECAS